MSNNTSWVRNRVSLTTSDEMLTVKFSLPKLAEVDDICDFIFIGPEVIFDAISSIFVDAQNCEKVLGSVTMASLIGTVYEIVVNNLIDIFFTILESPDRDSLANENVTISLSMQPAELTFINTGTNDKREIFLPHIYLDCGNLIKPSLGGLFSPFSSLILTDTTGCESGCLTVFHERMHAIINAMRESGLEDMMYGEGPDRREEIIVHMVTDCMPALNAMHATAKSMAFNRSEGTGSLNSLKIQNHSIKLGSDNSGLADTVLKEKYVSVPYKNQLYSGKSKIIDSNLVNNIKRTDEWKSMHNSLNDALGDECFTSKSQFSDKVILKKVILEKLSTAFKMLPYSDYDTYSFMRNVFNNISEKLKEKIIL